MAPLFIGIDIAGGKNTWLACLAQDGTRLYLDQPPRRATLGEIIQMAEHRDVTAAAIDAQLSIALSEENGFRSSDSELRALLPSEFRSWVASVNSLMAVPIRARLLSDALAPSIPTILETHPRACLYFGCGPGSVAPLRQYKRDGDVAQHVEPLWKTWAQRFKIEGELGSMTDGALDATVCAPLRTYHTADRSSYDGFATPPRTRPAGDRSTFSSLTPEGRIGKASDHGKWWPTVT
jgi:hypothetical protein